MNAQLDIRGISKHLAPMTRHVLNEEHIHPSIRHKVSDNHRAVVEEVLAAVHANPVVVVGMKRNPHCTRVRKALASKAVHFQYLEYGSYISGWRRRNALKMWTGWPTFPMVFHQGVFVGGADETEALLRSGEIASTSGRESVPDFQPEVGR